MNEISRMAAPYQSDCRGDWEDTGLPVTAGTNYSLALCQRLCHQVPGVTALITLTSCRQQLPRTAAATGPVSTSPPPATPSPSTPRPAT